MYKKIPISLLLIASITFSFSPVAEAKGTPIIGDAIKAVKNVITFVLPPFISAPILGVTDFIGNLVAVIANTAYCAVDLSSCLPDKDLKKGEGVSLSAPSAPQNVEITNCDGTERNADGSCLVYINHGYRITWDAPVNFGGASSIGYKIYRGESETSLNTLITNPEMDAVQKYFEENRIKDPSNPFYYKVVAFNSAYESDGIVVMAPTDIRYLTDVLTLTGSGFSDNTKVYLINNGNSILCVGFTAPDSHTLTGGVCDITSASTGSWTVRIQAPDGKRSDCVDCFRIALPKPISPAISITKTDLSDGIFKINSIAGDNLYTGASVRVVYNNQKLDCFSLSSFDYKNNKFPGGQCNTESFQRFIKTLGFTDDSDVSKLSVEVSNDPNSASVIPDGIPTNFSCSSSVYTPDASTICGSSLITQYSNCGVARSVMPELICSSGQVCQDGACVGCIPKTKTAACGTWVCGSVSDGCSGTVSCGTCTAGTCTNGVCM